MAVQVAALQATHVVRIGTMIVPVESHGRADGVEDAFQQGLAHVLASTPSSSSLPGEVRQAWRRKRQTESGAWVADISGIENAVSVRPATDRDRETLAQWRYAQSAKKARAEVDAMLGGFADDAQTIAALRGPRRKAKKAVPPVAVKRAAVKRSSPKRAPKSSSGPVVSLEDKRAAVAILERKTLPTNVTDYLDRLVYVAKRDYAAAYARHVFLGEACPADPDTAWAEKARGRVDHYAAVNK